MGQLEKYGLYVLCLVIFLILGVTIWGGGDLPPAGRSVIKAPMKVENPGHVPTANQPVGGNAPGTQLPVPTNSLAELLRPAPQGPQRGPVQPANAVATRSEPPVAGELPKAGKGPAVAEPVAAARPTHKVRAGDSFDRIARERLGNAALRTEIARLNPGIEPTKLKPGDEILLPTTAELASSNPGGALAKPVAGTAKKDAAVRTETGTYTVAKGDTFERIAGNELGSKKRVKELRDLNPSVEPEKLQVGMKIKLPKK